jgi:hypothetical protein
MNVVIVYTVYFQEKINHIIIQIILFLLLRLIFLFKNFFKGNLLFIIIKGSKYI